MSKFKVGDRVVNAPSNVGDTVTGIIETIDQTYRFPYRVRSELNYETRWAGDPPEVTTSILNPTASEGDEFTVMRVCASWIDGLPTDLEKSRVIKYLEDRFDTL